MLLQTVQPVDIALCTLTETQCQYAEIEKQLLAVQFGMQHFHHYVHGSQVVVETDHKPLVSLVDMPIGLCTPIVFNECVYNLKPTLISSNTSRGRSCTLRRATEPRKYSSETLHYHE